MTLRVVLSLMCAALLLTVAYLSSIERAVFTTLLAGILCCLVDWYFQQRRKRRPLEVAFFFVAFVAACVGVISALASVWDDVQNAAQDSQHLQADLHQDSRFLRVTPTYQGNIVGRTLTISGTVSSLADEQALRDKAAKEFWYFKTNVRWNVAVDPE